MAIKQSAGLLMYRKRQGRVEVLVAHPGGPFFAKKDDGVWTIPKGLYDDEENALDAAEREFEEETGCQAPHGNHIELGEIERKDGKFIIAWAIEGDFDTARLKSNTFSLEWPPKSGKKQDFPEVDRAEWHDIATASRKLQTAQVEFLKRLADKLGIVFDDSPSDEEEKPKQNSLF